MKRCQELQEMLTQRRVGFRIDETLRGTHRFLKDWNQNAVRAGSEFPFEFHATWGASHLGKFFNPLSKEFLVASLAGSVTAGGICTDAPMKGTLEFAYFSQSLIRYSFAFQGGGHELSYIGEKRHIRPWNLRRSHTTCYGTLSDARNGNIISDSVVFFDLKKLAAFFASLRFG